MRPVDESHDPRLRSWVESANRPGADFPIQNLPFGVFRRRGALEHPRIGVAIGDEVFDLSRALDIGLLHDMPADIQAACGERVLNALAGLGSGATLALRHGLIALLKTDAARAEPTALVPMNAIELELPLSIGNYTDFYASIFHATRVGSFFRPDNPLLPNYKFVPIAYHGRASSIVASRTQVRRPRGQVKPPDSSEPLFRSSQRLDYEVEAAVIVGTGNGLGQPLSIDEAEDHIFGLALLNDWSARDIQAWEYQPLGPFLAKNFATTISPWLVTLEALAPYRCEAVRRPTGDPDPLPYLSSGANAASGGVDLRIETEIVTSRMREHGLPGALIGRSCLREMYWTIAQMVTHHTSNGCNLCPGDLIGTGTVSGPEDDSLGCLLEITRQGSRPLELPSGERRTFLEDGDDVIMRGYCERDGFARIGFGTCEGRIVAT